MVSLVTLFLDGKSWTAVLGQVNLDFPTSKAVYQIVCPDPDQGNPFGELDATLAAGKRLFGFMGVEQKSGEGITRACF